MWQFFVWIPASVSTVRLANWVYFGSIYRFETATWQAWKPTKSFKDNGRLENPPTAWKILKSQIRPTVRPLLLPLAAPSACVPASVSATLQFFVWIPTSVSTCASILGLYTVSRLPRDRLENQKPGNLKSHKLDPLFLPLAAPSACVPRLCERYVAIFLREFLHLSAPLALQTRFNLGSIYRFETATWHAWKPTKSLKTSKVTN